MPAPTYTLSIDGKTLTPTPGSGMATIKLGANLGKVNIPKFINFLNASIASSPTVEASLVWAGSEGVEIYGVDKLDAVAEATYNGYKSGDGTFKNTASPYELKMGISLKWLDGTYRPGIDENARYEAVVDAFPHEVLAHAKYGRHAWPTFPSSYSEVLLDQSYLTTFQVDMERSRAVRPYGRLSDPSTLSVTGYLPTDTLQSVTGLARQWASQGVSQSQIDYVVNQVATNGFYIASPGLIVVLDTDYLIVASENRRYDLELQYKLESKNKNGSYAELTPGDRILLEHNIAIQIIGGEIGEVAGSALGRYLAKNNAIKGIVYSSLLGEIGQRLGSGIVAGARGDSFIAVATQGGLSEFGTDVVTGMGQAAIGTVSSLLSMELGEALGLDGFGAELFATAGSSVISNAFQNLVDLGPAEILNGFKVSEVFKGSGFAVSAALGSYLGGKLGAMILAPQTQAAVALSSMGQAVGAFLAIRNIGAVGSIASTVATAITQKTAGLIFSALVPGVGALIGFVLGSFFGNLFGSKPPPPPTASAETVLQRPNAHYAIGAVAVANYGNYDLAVSMAGTARDTLNGIIQLALGDERSGLVANTTTWTDQIYGHTGSQIYVKINGITYNKASADKAVEYGVLHAIRGTDILGGDIFVKRAIERSAATDIVNFAGDLAIAGDYRFYVSNRTLIDEQIVGAYATLTQTEEDAYGVPYVKALVDKIGLNGLASLDSTEVAYYTPNKVTIDKVVEALASQATANPWIVTLQRAAELGINQWTPSSDWIGATRGFLDHFDLADYGLGYEDIKIGYGAGSLIFTATGAYDPVPEEGPFSILPQSSANGRILSISSFAGVFGYNASGAATWAHDVIDFSSTSYVTVNEWQISTGYLAVTYLSGGDDIIIGGSGGDILAGANGRDWIDGGAGDDKIFGGDDSIFAAELTSAYAYYDYSVYMQPSNDGNVLLGGSGADLLVGGDGDDYLAGGDGDDWALGGPSLFTRDPVSGFPVGFSYWDGGLWGGGGNDVLVGGNGLDKLQGQDGDDTFIVDFESAGHDWFDGGAGSDTISYERFTNGIGADLSITTTVSGLTVASFYNHDAIYIENLRGSAYDDLLIGDASVNRLWGGAGDDILRGAGSHDILEGGAGADVLYGEGDGATISYAHSLGGVYIDLTTSEAFGGDADGDTWDSSINNVEGSEFADQLKGTTAGGWNGLWGFGGDDWFVGTGGNDSYFGGEGMDFVDYSEATEAVTVNISGYNSGVPNYGYAHAFTGSTGLVDMEGVVGSNYDDNLYAMGGNQTFVGGKGADTLNGGTETDTYYYNRGDGWDVIWETADGANVLVLGEGIKAADFSFATVGDTPTWQIRGTNDKITVVDNNVGTLQNKIKTISFNGASKLDVSQYKYVYSGTDAANTLTGGAGTRDFILGFNGNDTLNGSSSAVTSITNDIIIGGLGTDIIYAATGDHQFVYDRGDGFDAISDRGGNDTIVFGSTIAAEDVMVQVWANDLFIGIRDPLNPTLGALSVSDRIRIIDGGVKRVSDGLHNSIETIMAGGVTIDIDKLDLNWTMTTNLGPTWWAPVVFDLENDGLDLASGVGSSIVTRTEGGTLTKIGWAGPTDGFLAVDRDGDGKISKLSEISFTQDKPGATSDLEGLATWDSNTDGVLDAKDARWGEFRLFVDANQNGRSSASELKTLEQAGISSISLKGVGTGRTFASGIDNFVQNDMTFTRTDGTTGNAFDVALARYLIHATGAVYDDSQAFADLDADAEMGRVLNDAIQETAERKKVAQVLGADTAEGLYALTKLGGVGLKTAQAQIGQALESKTGESLDDIKRKLTYEDVKASLKLDFSDSDVAISDIAKSVWIDKLDPKRKAALEADKADGLIGENHLAEVNAKSSDQAEYDALIAELTPQMADAPTSLRQSAAMATFVPETQDAADGSTPGPTAGDDMPAAFSALDSSTGRGSVADFVGAVMAGGTKSTGWWRADSEAFSDNRPEDLQAFFTRLAGGSEDKQPLLAAQGLDAEVARRQQLLRQGLAAFGRDAGAAPAVWARSGATGVAQLSVNPAARLNTSIKQDALVA